MFLFLPARRRSLAAALTLAVSVPTAFATTTRNFTNTNGGDWGTASNWSPTGLPGTTTLEDIVLGNVTMTGVNGLSVNIIGSEGTNFVLNSLTLNSHGIAGFMTLNQSGSGAYVNVTTENIGTTTSDNTYNLSAGYNYVSTLNIGVSSVNNAYNISATGTLGVNTALNIGVSGNGVFTQSGGNVTVDDPNIASIVLGVNSGGFGTYNLSNGSLGVDTVTVGKAGTGVFNQTGGTLVSYDSGISICSTLGTATYNYSNGTITIVGGAGVSISTHGTFNLQAGASFDNLATIYTGGIFNAVGGAFTVNANIDLEGGILQIAGTPSVLTHFDAASGIVQNGASSGTLTLNVAPQNIAGNLYPYQFNGTIRDNSTGNMSLSLTGGQLGLFGSNTYSGPTTLAGTLLAQANNTLSPNSTVALLANGILDAGAFSNTIATLAGTGGTLNLPTGSSIATSSSANSTSATTFAGNGTFTKAGTGTLFLSNGGSAFTGTIAIQGGTLAPGAVNGIPTNAFVTYSGLAGTLSIGFNQAIANFSAGDLNPVVFTNSAASLALGGGNVDNFIGGNFSGTGSLVKNGTANLTIGGGSADTVPSSDSNLTVTVNSGTLLLNKAPGTAAVAGSLVLNGGVTLLQASDQIADTVFVNLSGGTLNLNGFNETTSNLYGPSGTLAVGTGAFTTSMLSSNSYGGAITGTGKFVKAGAADLTLSGPTTFGGTFVVNAGRLILQNSASASAFIISSGAFLRFSSTTVNLGASGIQPSAGGTVEYTNAAVNGGFLDGPGTHSLLGNAAFNGTSAMPGSVVSQTGAATLTNFINGGTFTNAAPLTWSFGTNAFTGTLNVNSTLTTQNVGNAGIINIAPGGTITNTAGPFILGGGSRTYLGNVANHGGTITLAAGTTLEVNGALLVNDGTITGTTNINYGGTAEGIGTYGPVNISFGGNFEPGFASSALLGNAATVTALSGSGTIDNLSTGPMTLALTGSSTSTFSGPIQNTTGFTNLVVQGTSSLTLLTTPLANGSQSINTFTGGLSIASGASVIIGAIGALPANSAITNNGSLTINASSTAGIISGLGTLSIASNTALTLNTSSGGSKQGALSLTPTSTLNLTNNQLVIEAPDSVTKTIDLTQLAGLITSGKSTPYGITSSALGSNLAIALIDNGSLTTPFTTFGGQPVDGNSILVAPELLGDANIDGHVDLNDLNTVLNDLGTMTPSWTAGNFDGATTIDLNDLNAVLNHLGTSYANSSTALITESLTPTPEPASLALLCTVLLVLLRRRSTSHP